MNRQTLFRKSKPLLRPFVSHEEGELGPDIGILWAAYRRGSFSFPEMDERNFTDFILKSIGKFSSAWIMEDDNAGFRSGRGPVCIVGVTSNGWKITPQVFWFSWASAKNRLRCTVAFLQKSRFDKTLGCCEVRAERKDLALIIHATKFLTRYVPRLKKRISDLRFVGAVWFGTPAGDQYIYSLKGGKHAGADGRGKAAAGVQRDSAGERSAGGGEERESVGTGTDVQGVEERDGHE